MGELSLLETLGRPEALALAFQPIFDLREPRPRLHGLEVLVRGAECSGLESSARLFSQARQEGVESSVDRICLEAIFRALGQIAPPCDVSVNVHASTLGGDRHFPAFLLQLAEAHGIDPVHLTVEIVGQDRAGDDAVLQDALRSLRQAGTSIALDDVGLGQSSYQMMLDCAPDFLKVDRYLVRGCDEDMRRRAILDSVFLLGARLGARMIAEGVESAGELHVLASLGVELVQGFLLSRPIPAADLRQRVDMALSGGSPLFLPERPLASAAQYF